MNEYHKIQTVFKRDMESRLGADSWLSQTN